MSTEKSTSPEVNSDSENQSPVTGGPSPEVLPRRTSKRLALRRLIWRIAKVPVYAVFLIAAVGLILFLLDRLSGFLLGKTYLGEVYPKNLSMVRRDFTRPVSHYDYDFVPRVCLEYNILKGNRFEYANNAGFREPRDISLEKPHDEYRIFLTGGSTAYGLGATGEATQPMGWYGLEYRETISHIMEMILNAEAPVPGKTIRVYNTAVWGYAYQHLLMRYLTKLSRYNPDLVVSFDGANEIPIVSKISPHWDYFNEGQFNNILRDIYAYNGPGLASYLTLWLKNNTFLMTWFWAGRDIFQELNTNLQPYQGSVDDQQTAGTSHSKSLEEISRLLDQNIARVVRVVENYHTAIQNDGIPHILALQPWFYSSKKPLHEREKVLAGLQGYRHYYGVPSDKVYNLLIGKMKESAKEKGYFLADFSDYFDDVSEWVFTDWCHLTSGANYLVAKELSNLVKEHVFRRSLTRGDATNDKDSFFWDLAASGTILYAPPADSARNVPQNILSGYPRSAVYSSQAVPPEGKLEVALDLGQEYPVSRLRLVWADEAAVPEQWVVEASLNQETWETLVQGTNKQTDNFSRWPGFEHYAAEPVQARYLRYRPLAPSQRSVRLRSWSVFR
jgi:F5/8 type C domain